MALEDPRKRLGRVGEAAAVDELRHRGYRILERNFRCRGGEADVVAEEGDALVFIEVKTRTGFSHGLPQEAVGWRKQQHLGIAAEHYCRQHDLEDRPIRFDVVEVLVLRGDVAGIEIHAAAFVPEG